MRIVILSVLLFLPATCFSQAPRQDLDADLAVRNRVAESIVSAWSNEDFSALEAMMRDYVNPTRRTPSGWRLLAVYQSYLSKCISIRGTEKTLRILVAGEESDDEEIDGPEPVRFASVNQEWDKVEAKIARWQKRYSKSQIAAIAAAMYRINRGYYFRGTNAARSVNAEAWPIFKSNIETAGQLLLDAKDLRLKNPIWFSLMLDVLGMQSAPKSGIEALALDTLENGQGYIPAFQSAFHYVQPNWGGSYVRMEEFARQADEKSAQQERGQMYARLYWGFVGLQTDEVDFDFFKRTQANWLMLSRSFEGLIKSYPQSRNFSGYALFACMAGDSTKAGELLTKAQTKTYTNLWPPELRQRCVPRYL